jgi:AcrR family transcriptional regulator
MTGRASAIPDRGTGSGRPGRRPGPSQTREAVLAAARRLFAAHGYERTTIRAIGREADVDAALVHHYFGSKEQVFVAAMEFPFDPVELVREVVNGPREEVAQRLVRFFLSVWRDPVARASFVAILRSANTNDQAAAMLREFISSALLAKMAGTLGLPRLRLEGAAAQLVGIALVRYVVGIEPLASASEDEIVALVTPVIEYYLSG